MSVEVWQDLHPWLLLMASSSESPNASGDCPEACWTFSWGRVEFAQPTVKRPPRNKQASDTGDNTDQERGFLPVFMNDDLSVFQNLNRTVVNPETNVLLV